MTVVRLKKSKTRTLILMFWFIVVGLYLFTRLYNLTLLPIFFDEANYIFWAKVINQTNQHWFVSLSGGKPAPYIWFIVLAFKTLPAINYLVAARLTSVFFGLVTMFGVYSLGNATLGRRVAFAAVFLYVICPFALFHDRLALYDSMLLAMVTWASYFVIKRKAVLWGLFLGFALLTKASALAYEILLPAAYLILNNFKKLRLIVIAFIASQIVANVQIVSKGYLEYIQKSVDYTPGGKSFNLIEQIFIPNLVSSVDWLSKYFTSPILLICLAGMLLLIFKKGRIGLFYALLGIAPVIGFSFLGKIYFPRYILVTVPFLLIPGAYFLNVLASKFRFTTFAVLPFILFLAVKFDSNLIFSPQNANFPKIDRWQYITGDPSGYGINEIFNSISTLRQTTMVTESEYYGNLFVIAQIYYFENPKVKIIRRWWNVNVDKEISLAHKLGHVFYVTAQNSAPFNARPLKTAHRPENESAVYLFKIEP